MIFDDIVGNIVYYNLVHIYTKWFRTKILVEEPGKEESKVIKDTTVWCAKVVDWHLKYTILLI